MGRTAISYEYKAVPLLKISPQGGAVFPSVIDWASSTHQIIPIHCWHSIIYKNNEWNKNEIMK